MTPSRHGLPPSPTLTDSGCRSGRVALDDYVDLVSKLKAKKQGSGNRGPTIPGRPGAQNQNKAVLGGATMTSSHTIDQEE